MPRYLEFWIAGLLGAPVLYVGAYLWLRVVHRLVHYSNCGEHEVRAPAGSGQFFEWLFAPAMILELWHYLS